MAKNTSIVAAALKRHAEELLYRQTSVAGGNSGQVRKRNIMSDNSKDEFRTSDQIQEPDRNQKAIKAIKRQTGDNHI